MSRRFRMTRLLKSCSRCDGGVVCIFYWFSFSCARHGNDVLVFVAVPVPRPAIFFMTMTTPFVSLLALSCTQPRLHRSLSASLAPVTILINSLTLEVYSIVVSTTPTTSNCGDNLCKEIWRRNFDVGNCFFIPLVVSEPIITSVSIPVHVPHNCMPISFRRFIV